MFVRLAALAAAIIVVDGSGAGAGAGAAAGAAAQVHREAHEHYASSSDVRQSFDWYPAAGIDRPFVITIHGGSWRFGDKADRTMVPPRRQFNRLGITVFSINYRLAGRGVTFADITSDINVAFRYIRRHARQYRIDPDRGILYGHSAGGHLAAILGLEGDGHRGIRGIITTSGVLAPDRTTDAGLLTSQRITAACRGSGTSCRPAFLPRHYLSPHDPPILAFQGAKDGRVDPIEPRVLRAWAARSGVRMTVVTTAGYGHSYEQLWRVPANLHLMLRFVLARLGCAPRSC